MKTEEYTNILFPAEINPSGHLNFCLCEKLTFYKKYQIRESTEKVPQMTNYRNDNLFLLALLNVSILFVGQLTGKFMTRQLMEI